MGGRGLELTNVSYETYSKVAMADLHRLEPDLKDLD